MTLKDYFTLGISLVALIVSGITAARTWRSNTASFRNTARNNYMNALFDLNRQVLTRPELWAVYDPGLLTSIPDTPLEAVRRRAFIWFHLNVFEVVHADYFTHRITSLDHTDELCWRSWDNFVSNLLNSSAEARAIVESDDSMALLNRQFVEYLRGKIPARQEAMIPVVASAV